MSTADPTPDRPIAPTVLDHAPPPAGATLAARLAAEFAGTFLLVFGAIGAALFAADAGVGPGGTSLGIGFVGVALAFGLTIVAAAYTWGPISGGHFNPAVTVGLAVAGRCAWRDVPGYLLVQIAGGAFGALVLYLIGLSAPDGWLDAALAGGFASNGYGEHSPGGFGLGAAVIAEIVLTAVFVLVILGVTHSTRGTPLAGLVIGLTLTLIHLVSIPIDNTSVNPARSIATAVFGGAGPLGQLWVFLVFPVVGAVVAGVLYRFGFDRRTRA